jgi:hypothetical protein
MDLLKAALYLFNLSKGFIMENNTINAARPLSTIARDIRRAWPRVYFAAVPYLEAMASLNSINDKYMYDDARGIVRYFLANAAQFRGESAKALKAELKALL